MMRVGAEIDLSAVWLIRHAMSEFVAWHRVGIAPDLPLRRPDSGEGSGKRVGGSHGM